MTASSEPAVARPRPLLETVFGELWDDHQVAGRPLLVTAAAGVGAVAAGVLPDRSLGLGTFLPLLGMVAVAGAAGRDRWSLRTLGPAALVVLLLATLVVRDAEWIVVLCVLAAAAVTATTLTGARTAAGLAASPLVIGLAGLRGLPWLRRSVVRTGSAEAWWSAVRTGAITVLLVGVFGALFASADAVFARWADALVPELALDDLGARAAVFLVVWAAATAGAYVALAPPAVDRLAPPPGRAVRRFEWLLPVGGVIATFLGFLAAQSAALFGGHGYLNRTTGLTYAEYVHEGFGQLTLATALTLVVVGVTARRASRDSARDRLLLRAALGLLCALTLVVVASALYRMYVYEEAYGFTRLRLLVSTFEAWLGLVVCLVVAAGVRLRGGWVPRAGLLAGAAMLLALAAVNPDAFIAERNVERFQETGRIDLAYLHDLSADAVPALTGVPGIDLCAMATPPDDLLEWNLGRSRADAVLRDARPGAGPGCG